MRYKDSNKDLPDIAGELNVSKVLSGAVQIIGNDMRVNVSLIDAATDTPLWSETYLSPFRADDYFTTQGEITERIVDSLNAILTIQERNRLKTPPTDSTEALQAFLLAREIVDSANQTRRDEGIALLREAIETDPNFVEAHIYLARAHLVRRPVGSGYNWRREEAAKAESAIDNAMSLDNSLAETHLVKGRVHAYKYQYVYDSEFEPPVRNDAALGLAKRSLDRALELDPSNAAIYAAYGSLASLESNLDSSNEERLHNQALNWFRKAVELDPQNIEARISLASHLRWIQDRDEMEKHYREALRAAPRHSGALRNLGVLLIQSARFDEAIPLLRKSIAFDPDRFEPHGYLAQCYHFIGDDIESLRWIKAGAGSGRSYGSDLAGVSQYRALRAMTLGDNDEYLRQLRIATKEKTNHYMLRRKLLNLDMRAGRFESALERYQSYFPYLFAKDYAIDGSVNFDTENPMSERFQAMAIMEIAEILLELGERDRAIKLLDMAWKFFRDEYPDRHGWSWAYTQGYGIRDAIRYALIGDKDDALRCIREAVEGRFRDRLELESSALDSIREETEFKAAMIIVEADWARQLSNVRRMEANGELAPIPNEPRYRLETPTKTLAESR